MSSSRKPRSSPSAPASSELRGASSYSFGRPPHLKGKFKIPTVDPRSADYIPGVTDTPGVGSYNLQQTLCRHDAQSGHPEFHRAPGYAFGMRTQDRGLTPLCGRDLMARRYAADHQETPGPGHHLGLDGTSRLLERKPAYSMRSRSTPSLRKGAGEPGPFEYDTQRKQRVTQPVTPAWTVSRQERGAPAMDRSERMGTATRHPEDRTPDDVGPGSYGHLESMVTQFAQGPRRRL